MFSGSLQKTSSILVIDDEQNMVDACSQMLRREGYVVHFAFDGENGFAKFREINPDMVIVDLKMPEMCGMEVIEKIHAINENTIIIVITGHATFESAVNAMKKGAFDFLPKPFTPEEIKSAVSSGLERKRLLEKYELLRSQKRKIQEDYIFMAAHQIKGHIEVIQQYFEMVFEILSDHSIEKNKDIIEQTAQHIDCVQKIVDDWLKKKQKF